MIDYTKEDFTKSGQRYDVILDNVGNHSFSECKRALTSRGILISNTGHAGMSYVFKAFLRSMFIRQQGSLFVAKSNHKDLTILKEIIESEKVKPVIDRTYPLSQTPEAIGYVGEGHALGKVVITIGHNNKT